MRGPTIIVAGVVAAALVAGGAFFALRRSTKTRAPEAAPAPQQLAGEIVLPARLRAQQVVGVPAPVQGVVDTLLADTGDQVYEGQLLGRIRNTEIETEQQAAAAALERFETKRNQLESELIVARADASQARSDAARADAELARAERAWQRQQLLFREGATPRLVYEKAGKEYETAKRDRDTADEVARGAEERAAAAAKSVDAVKLSVDEHTATLERAREAATRSEIHSPATGVVVERTRQTGDEVTPDVQDLFVIATDIAALEAVLEPPAPALSRIRVGQEALISVAEAPDAISARVSEVQGGQVLIRFASPTAALRPGGTAQVRIRLR